MLVHKADASKPLRSLLAPLLLLPLVGGSMIACQSYDKPSDGDTGQPADLVLLGGRIVTMNAKQPEVEALASRDGVLVAVGGRAEVEALIGEGTEVVDLGGQLAIPGFVEGHAHFLGVGDQKIQLPLAEAMSWQDIVAMVLDAAETAPAGSWIRGRGWHQDKWSDQPARVVDGFPTHDELSAAAPDHPVLLTHASGHAVLVNAKALELAGIDGETPDPPGGDIVRDVSGRATGLLNETAEGLVQAVRGETDAAEIERMIELASQECQENGITSFQDAGQGFDEIAALREASSAGKVGTRLWVMLGASNEELAQRLPDFDLEADLEAATPDAAAAPQVVVGGIKRYMDGALGSRGALLLEPYSDDRDTSGLRLTEIESLRETAELAVEHGLQLCVHAIGDRANREVLDLFADTFAAHPEKSDLRWRIEHAQHLDPADLPRFAELGVVASVQSVHCTSDGPWVPDRLGSRRAEEGAYMWRDLIDSGARVINGTDAPVEDIDPIANFASAVTRRVASGEVFFPDQVMTRPEALRSMTLDAAWGAFQSDRVGSLEVGKLADVVVLDKDILTVPDEEIETARVMLTVLGGRIVHRGGGEAAAGG
ncbi:MAG: amidohydrolase [Acidobacteriota bacterium]